MTEHDARMLLARIAAEPGKMGGKPIIRGRRVTPGMVLVMLANGATHQEVLDAYPVLEAADIEACLLYASRLAERADADGATMAAAEQVRVLADTNIVAPAVRALRSDGHDLIYSAERDADPGDSALLAEAHAEARIFITKDHDIGALVFRDGAAHAGVLLIDDLGSVAEEMSLLRSALADMGDALAARQFVRAGLSGCRIATR